MNPLLLHSPGRSAALAILGGLAVAWAGACSATGSTGSTSVGCHADVDCKGSRICQAGVCVSPGTGGSGAGTGGSGAGTTGSAAASSSSTGGGIYCQMPSDQECLCQAGGLSNDVPCGPSVITPAALCCANGGWPQSGSCTCSIYTCATDPTGVCHCSLAEGGSVTTCTGNLCCEDGSGDGTDCLCTTPQQDETSCSQFASAPIQVPTCNLPDVVCGDGYQKLTTCRE